MPTHRRISDLLRLPWRGRAAAALAIAAVSAAVALSEGAAAADPCDSTWDGGAGTPRWVDASNWSGDRRPADGAEVCIPSGASVEFSLADATVGGLRVGGALTISSSDLVVTGAYDSDITGTLTLKGTGRLIADGDVPVAQLRQQAGTILGSGTVTTPDFDWSAGAQTGSGVTRIAAGGPGLAISGSSSHVLDAGRQLRVEPDAAAEWTGGTMDMRSDARLANAGSFAIAGDLDMTGCCAGGQLVNEASGTIRKTAGSGASRLHYPFANDGAVEVLTGAISLEGGSIPGHDSAGRFDVADGAELRFPASTTQLTDASSVVSHGAGRVVFSGGSTSLPGHVDARVTIDGSATYAFFDADATLPRVELRDGHLGGDGTVTTAEFAWTGGAQIGHGRTRIAPGGAGLEISGDGTRGLYERELAIDQDAVATWTGGAIEMTETAAIENAGLFDVRGDSNFVNCCFGAPRVHNRAGGTFRKTVGVDRTAIPYEFVNDGTVEADAGTLALGRLAGFGGGRLAGGRYVVRAGLELPDAVQRNAAALDLYGPGASVADPQGGDALRDLAENEVGGELTVEDGAAVESSAAELANAGTVAIGADSTLRAAGAYRQTGGLTTVAAPTATVVADAGGVRLDGGALDGDGVVDASLTSAAAVEPGSGIGTLTVTGDYTQEPDGTLALEVAGPELHDRLDVRGTAALAGTLAVAGEHGYLPAPDDQIEVVRHGAETGEFDSATGLQPDADHAYGEPDYAPAAVWLRTGTAPDVSIGDATLHEGTGLDTDATLDVTLAATPTRTVTLEWSTADGAATAPGDYEERSGTLTIPHGTTSASIAVPVHGDADDEPDEDFHVELTRATHATIAGGRGTVTILDDDEPEPVPDPGPKPDPKPRPKPPGGGGGAGGASHGRPAPPPAPTTACADRTPPRSALRRGRHPVRLKHRRLRIRGGASDAGCSHLARVEVAIARHVRWHRRRRCRFLTAAGRLGRRRPCSRPRFVHARGTRRWRLRTRRALPRGRYTVQTRAVDGAGNRETQRRRRQRRGRNFASFRVR